MDQRTSSSGGGNSAEARQLSSGSTIPFSARLPPSSPRRSCRTAAEASAAVRGRRHGGERDVQPELICRTGTDLPPPDCPRSFGSSSAPGVHPRSCRTAAGRLRRRQSKLRRQSGSSGAGSSAAQLPECNPFLLHVAIDALQRFMAKVPFPQFFSTMAEISSTTSLYLYWKYQRHQTQSL